MTITRTQSGYVMRLSARDTYAWANRPSASWPCSGLRNHRLMVEVDSNGLYDMTVDGKIPDGNIDGSEIDACVSDHLPANLRHLWPVWAKVGKPAAA